MSQAVSTRQSAFLRSTTLAAILAAIVLLPLLGHKPLTDWDEGIYAEVSREMLTSGWFTPHWNQQLWFEKPPLMLWITAALYRGFGISELTARLGSALSGLACVTLLHAWLQRSRGTLTAWLTTVMLLACFGFLHISRVGEMDTLLSLGCVLSLIGLSEVNDGHSRGWYLFWSGATVALMTKGAASTTLFITALLLAVTQRWRAPVFSRSFWLGALIFLALTMPWHIAMYLRFGHLFFAEYFGLHVLSRATHQIEGHSTHWWFYLKVLLVSAPPFALLYPVAVFRSSRTGVLRAFAVFAGVEFLFFTVVQTRLPHYIAPAYPAFAVITADLLASHLVRYPDRPRGFWVKLTLATALICTASMFATSRLRASLHSSLLANVAVPPDNRDAIAVLRRARAQIQPVSGPLLVLRADPAPINVDVFYAGRRVQQVQIDPYVTAAARDRYIDNPVPLAGLVGAAPSLILLDKHLETSLPADIHFIALQQGREVDLGLVQRTSVEP